MTYSGETDAVTGICLDIYEGDFICVLGESGCGKSTLLKILAGFTIPSEGRVLYKETSIDGIDWNRGVVFQEPPLFEWLSVRKNVEFGPKMRGLKKTEYSRIAEGYIREVGLSENAESKIFELSGGMKQRVSIARTLANDPEILLMDEPFGALDAMTREGIQGLLRNIWHETGKTIFFITHDVEEALLLGTRIVVLGGKPGSIIEDCSEEFTHHIIDEGNTHIKYTDEFYKERERLLGLIHKAATVFQDT